MVTIGQQLQQARSERDLSVEDVAFHTRIPAARVRDMENGDLSRFANLTYARGFLKIYGEFLGLDLSDYLGQFHTEEFAHASGHEYVQTANATQNLPAAVFMDHGRSRSGGIYVLLLAMAAAGGIIWWNNRDAGTGESSASSSAQATSPSSTPPAVEKSTDSTAAGNATTASGAVPPATPKTETQPPATPERSPEADVASSSPAVPVPAPRSLPEATPEPAPAVKATPPKARVIEEQEP